MLEAERRSPADRGNGLRCLERVQVHCREWKHLPGNEQEGETPELRVKAAWGTGVTGGASGLLAESSELVRTEQ